MATEVSTLPLHPEARVICPNCDGRGKVVAEVLSRMYPCGYTTAVIRCAECQGMGLVPAKRTPDKKSVAAGDAS